MHASHPWFLTLLGLFLVAGPGIPPRAARPHSQETPAVAPLFDPDPGHLWNRIYRRLHVRAIDNRGEFAGDDLDPVLWHGTSYLRASPSMEGLEQLLDEFLSTHGERLIQDPVRHALLQRELWSIFDQLERPSDWPLPRKLLPKLVQVMQRVALTPEQIAALPDNYRLAVASRLFPADFDPATPNRAFLPPDLLDDKGPWVMLTRDPFLPVATMHLEEFRRSTFLVFLRVPGGRSATLAYLERVGAEPKPFEHPVQFPAGTQVALLRRMILVDSTGNLRPAPLTESLQVRVYREVPTRSVNSVESAQREQSFFEIVLNRARLLQGQSGGLRAIQPEEKEFTAFNVHFPSELVALRQCPICHSSNGVRSVRVGPFFQQAQSSSQIDATIWWKSQRREWGLLQWLWQ